LHSLKNANFVGFWIYKLTNPNLCSIYLLVDSGFNTCFFHCRW